MILYFFRNNKIKLYCKMEIIIPVQVETKDDQFYQLQLIIDSKRQSLLDKQKNFKILSTQNHFLQDIRDDYSKYYDYIIQQKQDQVSALSLLDKYIKDLTDSGSLSKQNIEDAKYEQKKILKEMNTIKKNIDSIVDI